MWIIKFLGVALLSLAGFLAGVLSVKKLKSRVAALEWFAGAVNDIGVRMNTTAAPISDIILTLYGKDEYLTLEKPFSVTAKTENLTPREAGAVKEFFGGVGLGELTSQVKRCEAYAAVFKEYSGRAYAEYYEKARLYKTLGFFAGLGLAIILI